MSVVDQVSSVGNNTTLRKCFSEFLVANKIIPNAFHPFTLELLLFNNGSHKPKSIEIYSYFENDKPHILTKKYEKIPTDSYCPNNSVNNEKLTKYRV